MKGKYMNVKRVVLSTLTVVMIASQLCGCAAVSKGELEEMISESETVTIETAEPLIVGERETREKETDEEAESTVDETSEIEAKSIEDFMKDIEIMDKYTSEELESIEEDARVYESYGSLPEQAVNMALADAENGKTNGSVEMTATLPVVVDENGIPYPTDEEGQPIIPENNVVKDDESENSTTAQANENVNEENVTPTAELSKRDTLPLTEVYDDDGNGFPMKVYGDDELIVITVDGVEREFNSVSEYRDFTYKWECDHSEEWQKLTASPDSFKDMGTWNGMAYSSEEEFEEAERNSTVHGKVQ